ncbi:hypothetical protein [Sulfitobacter sp.]|uniref:hypothetical protein n=1 Tax=Sulfitobacter sp. TaxID=1903071 RepID=UPI00300297EF
MIPDETLSTPLPSENTSGLILPPCITVDVSSERITKAILRQLTEYLGSAVREAETYRLMWALDEHDLPAPEDWNEPTCRAHRARRDRKQKTSTRGGLN